MDEQYSFREWFTASRWLYSNCGQGQERLRKVVITPREKERKNEGGEERKRGREQTGRILQNYLLLAQGCVVTYFNNVPFLPGCTQLSADTCSGRREWARIQFCT